MRRQQLINPNLPETQGYSRGIAARGGRFVVTSMTAPVDGEGRVVGPGDARAQAERVLVNLRDILELNGSALDDVVKVSAYVTRQDDARAVMEVIGAAFQAPPPALAVAVVAGLPNPDFLVEIEVIAIAE